MGRGGLVVALLVIAGCGGGGALKPDGGGEVGFVDAPPDDHGDGLDDGGLDLPIVRVDGPTDHVTGVDAPVDSSADAPGDVAPDAPAGGDGGSPDGGGFVGFWENPYVCGTFTAPQDTRSFAVAADGTITFSPTNPATSRTLSPDGALRATAVTATDAGVSADNIQITRVADGAVVATLGTAGMPARLPLAWSPDGTRLVTAGRDATLAHELRLWKMADGTLEKSIVTDNNLTEILYAPDGRSLLTNGSNESVVLDVATGLRKLTFPLTLYSGCLENALDVAFSPDGSLAATGTINGTFIWSTVDGHLVARLPSPSTTRQIAFTKFGIVTLDCCSGGPQPVIATRWCPSATLGDAGVTSDGGADAADASAGPDGGAGVGTCNNIGLTRGDFDGDGIIDCVQLNPPDVSFYKGLSGSAFATTPVVTKKVLPPGFTGVSEVVDMTGDGRQDLVYFANAGSTPSNPTYGYVAVGRFDGTFGSTCSPTGSGIFYASGSFFGGPAGDFTNDGLMDLLGVNIVNGAPRTVEPMVLALGSAGPGSGETGSPMRVGVGQSGSGGAGPAADIDGDGYLDTFVITSPVGVLPNNVGPNEVYVAWGNGTGKLFSRTTDPQPISSLEGATRIAPTELNGDGKVDLMVTFGSAAPSPYLGDGKGNFTPAP